MTHAELFKDDPEVGMEYSTDRTCPLSDSGFHCSCFDRKGECCICLPDEDTESGGKP